MRRLFLDRQGPGDRSGGCNPSASCSLRFPPATVYANAQTTTTAGFRCAKMGMYMKKTVLIAAALGMISLAACSKSPEAQNVEAVADNTADQLDANASAVSEAGENVAAATEAAADNTADAMHNKADAIREAGENKADAIDKKK